MVSSIVMNKEIWKTILGFENYKVSNFGRVKSINRKRRGFNHGVEFFYMSKDRLLKIIPRKMSQFVTYGQVNLFDGKKQKCFHVHRLVANCFIPNINKKPQVNHIDGNGLNNNVNNLEWVNGSENSIHAHQILGRSVWHKGKTGEHTPTSKPILQKSLKGKLIKRWGCGLDAVRDGGFESSCISRTCQGKSKTHKGFTWEYERI